MSNEMPIKNKSLVIILGAGASKEFGLPTGAELTKNIAEATNITFKDFGTLQSGDSTLAQTLNLFSKRHHLKNKTPQELQQAYRHIAAAMPQAISIDNFIDNHREHENIAICAKIAIVLSILRAENASNLYFDERDPSNCLAFDRLQETWFHPFFQIATELCSQVELETRLSQIAIISFNYDRCFEHHLKYSLQNYYGTSPQRAEELARMVDVYHPYGQVGFLPWQTKSGGIRFGESVQAMQLIQISEQLRTFTEGIDEERSDINNIRSVLEHARRIVYLGFAFHPINMDLLYPAPRNGGVLINNQKIYATAIGIPGPDLDIVRSDLIKRASVGSDHVFVEAREKCLGLMNSYRRSFSLTGS